MSSCFDVAKYILEKKKQMTAMKLQKLVYYSQAWSLVWDEKPLFDEPVEAWINGPMVPALYQTCAKNPVIHDGDVSARRSRSYSVFCI